MATRALSIGLLCAFMFGTGCRGQNQHTNSVGAAVGSSAQSTQVYALAKNDLSFIYLKPAGSKTAHRLSTRIKGWETEPTLSPSGKLVAYALADGPKAKSEVWISKIDGSHAHRISAPDEDALMPAFAGNDHTLLYVKSGFNGHYSPIARPRRHEFDVMKATVGPDGPTVGTTPVQLTQQHFFDLRSLSVSPDGKNFLVSTSGYPIGDLIEGFAVSDPLQIKFIYQPHVPSEPSTGPAYGQAAYIHDGMDIIFTAATEPTGGGNFDYSIYQMSAVTGGEITVLNRHSGMIDNLEVGRDGTIFVSADGKRYILDSQMHILKQI